MKLILTVIGYTTAVMFLITCLVCLVLIDVINVEDINTFSKFLSVAFL